MGRILLVTNDFPPRTGGIQSFLEGLITRLPADEVVVYAPSWDGARAYDAAAPFPVLRHPGRLMLPVPAVARRSAAAARRFGCDRVVFGAAFPLGLLAPGLRDSGLRRSVGITHGHEAAWAMVPGGRQVLRRIAAGLDVLTYLGRFTRDQIAGALRPVDRAKLTRLHPGVDADTFRPRTDGPDRRVHVGLGGRPVTVCVSRLVPRKGQDTLIRALPRIRARVPGAALLIVGGGGDEARLRRLAAASGVGSDVVFTGSVPSAQLPSWYSAGDVFAMPCRTRHGGLDVEGLGMVFLEASATGLPVVAGDSGGAPDAVVPGVSGELVDGRDVAEVGARIAGLLADPDRARQMGAQGRAWVRREWAWDAQARRLRELLQA